jgi:pimeloyl-ACP methyl ester carboxylesterase
MAQRPQPGLHVTTWGEGEPVVLVHGGLTYGDPADDDWAAQRPLAGRFQLIMPARRGYFQSVPTAHGDFQVDADDIAGLLGDGAHLVSHSYGGLAALLAAAKRPDAVRSLAMIEPPAFAVARGNPDVEAFITRMEPLYASAAQLTPEEYLLRFRRAIRGLAPTEPLELTDEDRQTLAWPPGRQGVEATMRERPPWEAEIPLDTLAVTTFPKLLVSGKWSRAFDAVGDVLEHRLHAERAVFAGAGHAVQTIGQPFNDRLVALWLTVPNG